MSDNKDLVPKKDTVIGNVLGLAAGIATLPVALAKGAYDHLNGDSFEKGVDSVCEPVFETVRKFGDDHADQIKNGITTVVAGLIVSAFTRRPPGR